MLEILIVDDSADNLLALHNFLSAKTHQVTQCFSGEEAFEILRQRSFDLVISDYQMPGGDGLWLLDKIQNLANPIKFILMSSEIGLDEKALKSKGCFEFFQRPVNWNKLDLVIQALTP
jgi:DNA-binding NtrC family response regulator